MGVLLLALLACRLAAATPVTVRTSRPDGVGTEFLRRLYVKCLADTSESRLEYAHTPFTGLEHGEDPVAWESLLGEYLQAPAFHGRAGDAVVTMPSSSQLLGVENTSQVIVDGMHLCPTLVDGATLEACATKVRRRSPNAALRARLSVAVHIRRGDMMLFGLPIPNPVRRDRVVPLETYAAILRNIQACLPGRQLDVTVYSEGFQFQFRSLVREFSAHVNSQGSAIDAFQGMRSADILVVGESSFSYAAALVHEGAFVVYDGRKNCPASKLPSWISPSSMDCARMSGPRGARAW